MIQIKPAAATVLREVDLNVFNSALHSINFRINVSKRDCLIWLIGSTNKQIVPLSAAKRHPTKLPNNLKKIVMSVKPSKPNEISSKPTVNQTVPSTAQQKRSQMDARLFWKDNVDGSRVSESSPKYSPKSLKALNMGL